MQPVPQTGIENSLGLQAVFNHSTEHLDSVNKWP